MAKRGRPHLDILRPGEVIVLYKAGSRGQIVGVYERVNDIVELEKPFNWCFSSGSVHKCIYGNIKQFRSFYHACKCVARIKKKSEVEWQRN